MATDVLKGLRKGEKQEKESGPGTYIRLEGAERDAFRAIMARLGHDPEAPDAERGAIKKIGQAVAKLGLAEFVKLLDADDAEAKGGDKE